MDRRRAAAALLALAACIACSEAAPTTTNHTALELHEGSVDGCYYNFQHYGEGDRIMTNEPCLNCTCHNRMLMCYLRVCPFTKAIGQDCTVEKRADQCCPIVTCPDVPVDLLTSTSTTSPAEYGATGLGKLDRFGCSIHGKYFPEGAKVPPTPNKPCEHCYCIRNMTTCVMQECTLHVDGCTPIYNKDVCCPVRYSCDHPEDELLLLDDMTTTVRPTPGFLLTTTTLSPVTQISQDCVHDDQIFPDGALIKTEKACEHCYCMKGDIVCVVQECGTPMENEGKNCTSLPPRHGQCCPDTYICEGDERVTDSTTDIVELTTLPPRRVGIEGSGYRNEPDEPYTEINKVTTEIEGSGEEFATVSPIDTGDNETQEKEITEMIDEILLTTTESGMQSGQSTEPDKGQNTIPDSVIDIETAREPITEKETLSSFGQAMSTVSEEYATTIDLTSDNNEITTIQSVLKVDEESVSDELSPTKDHEKATTDSSDVIGKTTLADEYMIHTNPTIIIESDQTLITTPATEFTNEVQEPTKQEDTSTEIIEPSIVTVANIEESKFTDGFHKSTEAEIFIESTTIPGPKLVVTDTTSLNPNINEIDDNLSPTSSPSRIPGEGDCLLNGITYSNNTSVPSSNNCHTGCKCISSIIKCDPIICSPPPEYMENMNDCQPIYDTPNSCCPTYVCSVKETIPPESHSHMSGTESPKPSTATECNGNDCIASIEPRPSMEPTECTSGNCLSETPVKQEECESNDCKDQVQTSPSQDCSDGKCHIFPDVSCEGDNCETETPKDKVPEKDLSFTTAPTLQEECESNDCKEKVQTSPSIPTQDCSDGKCQILTEVPCEGEKCSTEAQIDTITEKDLESTKTPATQEECISEDCKDQVVTSPSHECSDEKCQILPVVPCEGENCKTVTLESTSPEKDLAFTTTPALQEKCKSNDCNDQVQTSPLIPSQDCSDGKCQILPVVSCEGENCKTETLEDSITEKDLGITKTPAIKEECESSDCKDLVQPPPTQPTQDCSDGKCQTLPVVPCEGINCKSDVPENTFPEKNKEPNVYDLPSKTCNEENGCDETNLVGKDECVGESCKRKDVTGVGLEVPSKCSGSDCKLHDEPSAQSTEQPTEVTEGSTVSDINLQKTETIESHLTTIEEKLTDSELDVTRPPTNIEYSGKQSTTVVPIVTELPQQYDTEKEIVQTEIPIIQTGTEIPEEVTKTGTLPTESPRYPIEQTTESQDKHSSTDEQLTTKIDLSLTKVPEYFEIETEESFTKENEQFSTKKPYISTDAPLIVLADENTESPQITVTESNIVSEKDEINTEYPEIIDKEDVNKKYPEILVTAIEKTTEASFNIKETTLPAIVIKEKETMQSEIDNKNELFDTKVTDIVATEKELLHTEVTETFTEHQEAQTNAPEIFTTEKELVDAEILKVTAKEKETSQTGIPDKAVTETSQPELPESTEKQIIQTITPELETTAKSSSETESVTPLVTEIIQFSDATVTQKADVQTDFTEVTTEKEVGGVSIPDQHTIKEESTTTNVFDQASVEDQTVISLNTATDEAGSSYVTKETILEPETTITKKPEINYEVSKPIYSEEKLPTEDGIEVATERLVTYIPDVTKIETVPSDSYESVTQSINEPSLLEENVEITTKDSHILVTDELEMNTKSPQEISTKLGENAVPTDTDMLYTSSPDHFETVKSNEVSQTLDESVTESQMIITQEPEILSSKHYETFTLHVETVTDKYEESPITATDSPVQLTSIITDEQEKPSEVPELDSTVSQMEDKTTILPDTYLTTAISTDKPYVIPSLDSDKYDKDVTDKIHYTQDDIEKLTTADSSKLITEKPEIYTTQQQTSSDQKLDLESSFLTTEIVKKTEDSTDSEALVTEISETHSENPVLEEEKHQDSTTKTPEQTIVTETHKEGTDDNFTTQSTYKEELPTDQQQTISQEASYTKAVTDSDIETSSKTIVKDETESQEELTTTRYQTTEITDKSESEATISFTKTPEFEIATQRQPVSDTVKEEVTELPSYTEKEGVKPFISDEQASDTTEDSGLQEIYLSEHMGSQTTSQVQLEISTEKTSLPNKEDIDKKLQNEISTNVPVAITIIEQESSDRVTTEPQILHTSSEDKLSTNIDTLNMQKEQELDTDIFLTTPSSSQPEDDANLTELPMSLVTHVDHGSSSQTTLSDQIEMTEQALITNVDQTLEEEKPQTTLHEKYVTELQKQSTTEIPSHHITTQELQTETASKLNEDESNKLNTDQAERSTTSVMQNEYSMDQKTTPIPNKQYDFSTDGSTAGTVSSMYTSSFDTEKTIADNQPEITTTVPLREKEPHLSHEQGTPETESVDEMVKLPLTTQTVSEVVTTTTPSIVLDDEHIKEPISTTDIVTTDIIDQQRTEHPETILHDLQTIAPEKETSLTEETSSVGTETPKISTEKESDIVTSVYIPIVSELTEKPLTEITEINEFDNTEKDKPTEIGIQSVDQTTTSDNLELVTESDIVYTPSKVFSDTTTATQDNESSTEASDTKAPIQFNTSTDKIFTIVSEQDEQSGIPDASDNEKTAEDIASHSSTLIPEISTLITETQTKPTGIEKVTVIEENLSEEKTPKPIVTVKEEELPSEIYTTQPTIEKVSLTTEQPTAISIESEKHDTDVHTPTEFTPTTLQSSQSAYTHKEFDLSEDHKETTEPGHEASETTPFLVELQEHTHQQIDDSSRTSTEEIFTTALYERGDQNLDLITDKHEDAYQTTLPTKLTEHEHDDKLFTHEQDKTEQVSTTSSTIIKEITERLNDTLLTTSPEINLEDQEKQHITTVQDVVVTTSAAPQTISEKETFTTTSTDTQKLTYSTPETVGISTEKDNLGTELPLQPEASIGTTLLDEDLSRVTSQATTSKMVDETTRFTPITDKPSQPEEKPIKTTPPTQELAKPIFDDEINEGIPSPDFPPSGAGGYGQEPDYVEEDQAFGPGTCRYGGKVYVSAQQIPRDDPCDFCFCFRSDIICLQQSCPPPIHGCHEEPIQGFCCPRYECPVSMATTLNVTTTTTTTTTTLPPHFLPHAYKGAAQRRGCQIKGHTYKVGEVVRASSGPCLHCTCGGDGQMKCDPKACTPEPMLRQMIAAAVSAKRRR